MLNSTFYNEMLFTKLAQPAKAEAAAPKKPVAPKATSFADAMKAMAAKYKKEQETAFKRGISKSRAEESVPSRIGLTSKRFNMPQFLSSYNPSPAVTNEEQANALLSLGGKSYLGSGKGGTPLTYFTPQNVNRAAMLGGTVAGGVGGGNTLKSWGAGFGGSVGGSLVGGYASEGINRAIDAAYGIKPGSERGLARRFALDTVIPSLSAMAGGYYAGRATR
jgi:hypothetical protein